MRGITGKSNAMWHCGSSSVPMKVTTSAGHWFASATMHPARVLDIHHLAQFLEELVGRRLALAVALLGLVQIRDGVEPEPVDAHVHPEPHDLEDRVVHSGVVVVEVGLVREEAVEEELPPDRVERPVGVLVVGEDDADVRVLLVGVAPDVEVAVRTFGIGRATAGTTRAGRRCG